MTVEERRAVREALAPLGVEWQFTARGVPLCCPSCLKDEWMEGSKALLMEERDRYLDQVMFHFGCRNCGLRVPGRVVLEDLAEFVPDHWSAWN